MFDFEDKKVLIAGLGVSGKAVLEVLSKTDAIISVYDEKDIEWNDPRLYKKLEITDIPAYLNGIEVPDLDWDYIIMSPGIPMNSEFVIYSMKHNTKIIGELEFAYEMGKSRFVAITGTNGKTTTTTLVGEMYKNGNVKTIVGGNIGSPATSFISESDDDTVFVTEVSSFQLESIDKFKPYISAILNLTPDHMDRHKTMEKYGEAKARIFENQDMDDYLIYNCDDESVSSGLIEPAKTNKIPFSRKKELKTGAYVKDDKIVIGDLDGKVTEIAGIYELIIPGKHNLENALAASAIAYFGGIDVEAISKTLREFKGVSHRLELITTFNGIKFVNDSKGTNPDASMKAIDAVGHDIFLIVGGYDKYKDENKIREAFGEFIGSFKGRVKHLLLIGETAEIIKDISESAGFTDVTVCESMNDCVRQANVFAKEGDTVLLSPASASWDMYKNFEERGDHFRKAVEEIIQS